jgi:hypothetical protein
MRVAKQIVFRYNGDPDTEEIDLDMDGDKTVPKKAPWWNVKEHNGRLLRSTWKETQWSHSRFPFTESS